MSVPSVYRMVTAANFPPMEGFCYFGVLQLLKVKCDPGLAEFLDPLNILLENHHDELMVASHVGPRKAPCLSNVHTEPEALPYHDVVYLVVVLSIWAVPRGSSGCFVWAKGVRQHVVVVAGKFQES